MATTFLKKKNNAISTTVGTLLIGGTSAVLAGGGSAKFAQNGQTRWVIFDAQYDVPEEDVNREIVYATWISGEAWTLVREREDSTAKEWASGSKVWGIFTAGDMTDVETAVNTAETAVASHETRINAIETGTPAMINVQQLNGFQDTDFVKVSDPPPSQPTAFPVAIFSEVQPSTVSGSQQTSSGAETARVLNTVNKNTISGCTTSFSAWTWTLPSGTYNVKWRCSICANHGYAFLYNITDTIKYYGSPVRVSTETTGQQDSFGVAEFTIAAAKNFFIYMATDNISATNRAGGMPHGISISAAPNIYTTVEITKVA